MSTLSELLGGGGGAGADFQEFTTSGTWTKPAGAQFIKVEVWGAGGGGAGENGPSYFNPTGGGGGGGYHTRTFAADDLSPTVPVVIGAGGAGGGGGTPGADGGDSSFGGVKAFGGEGSLDGPVSIGGIGGRGWGDVNPAVPSFDPTPLLNVTTSGVGYTNVLITSPISGMSVYGGGRGGAQPFMSPEPTLAPIVPSGAGSVYGGGGGGGSSTYIASPYFPPQPFGPWQNGANNLAFVGGQPALNATNFREGGSGGRGGSPGGNGAFGGGGGGGSSNLSPGTGGDGGSGCVRVYTW